jgi:hypothetical protein
VVALPATAEREESRFGIMDGAKRPPVGASEQVEGAVDWGGDMVMDAVVPFDACGAVQGKVVA